MDKKMKYLTLSANVDRCLTEEKKDFCPECSKYKQCQLNKDLNDEQEKINISRGVKNG